MSAWIVTVLLFTGLFFFAVGTLGLVRMPNALCRIHATTKCDTLGGALIIIALAIHAKAPDLVLRLLLVLLFLWIVNPVGSHLLSRAIYRMSQKPLEGANSHAKPDR